MPKTTYRVLLVDNEPGMLEVLTDTLVRQEDLEVEPELVSTTAVERLRVEAFDLVVTNLQMPRLSGLTLLRLCRTEQPTLPVMIVTGYPEAESAAECRRLGAYAYLTKPFKPQDLVQLVRMGLPPEGRRAC